MANLIQTYKDPASGQQVYDWSTDDGQVHTTALTPETQGLYNQLAAQAEKDTTARAPAFAAETPATVAPTMPPADPAVGAAEVVDGGEDAPVPMPTIGTPSPLSGGGSGINTLTETATSDSFNVYDKDKESAYEQSRNKLIELGDAVNQNEVTAAQNQALEAMAYQKHLQKQAQDEEAARVAEEKEIQTEREKEKALIAAKEGMKLDSNRFWNNMDTGNRILAAVSLAMGALGQALTQGKSNMALDVINQAIDRDIHEQEKNLDNADKNIANQRGLLADVRSTISDKRTARSVTREMYLRAVKAQFDSLAATSNVDAVKDKAAFNSAQLQSQMDKEDMERTARKRTTQKQTKQVASTAAAAKPIGDRIERAERDKLAGEARILKGAEKLRDIVKSPLWQKNAGVISGSWLKAVAATGLNQSIEDMETLGLQTDADRIKYEVLKAMSGSGVTESEMSRYDPMFLDLQKNPKTAAVSADRYVQSAGERYNNTREEVAKLYRLEGDPEYDSIYPKYGGSVKDKKDKYRSK